MKSYQELVVWQKAMLLVKKIYELVNLLPKEETYALSDQMRRAAVSIPSNIAEGYSRNSDKELAQFLYIARGSKAELETQIQIAEMLKYFTEEQTAEVLELSGEVGKMINSFITKLTANS